MRITDNMVTNSYLTSLNSNKLQMQTLQTQLATESKINKPSDSPSGTARSLRLSSQINDMGIYSKNISTGSANLNFTTDAMDSINSEIDNILVVFTNAQNPVNNAQLSTYADSIDTALTSILNSANTEQDGKYIFGGTDFTSQPFAYSADGKSIHVASNDISGDQIIRTSPNTLQKINITGAELFGTKVKLTGNVDSTNAGPQQSTSTVYDTKGTAYNLNVTYTNTSANTYDMKYDVVDSGGTTVFSDVKSIKFDSNSGGIQSIDGDKVKDLSVNVPGREINFVLDSTNVTEKAGTSNFSYSANQKTDIFNTLIAIRDSLKAGNQPTEDQIAAVKSFSSHLTSQESIAGNLVNSMTSTDSLLTSQSTELTDLLSKEKDVDVAQAIMDLQNKNYLLTMSYKVASMILPKSLLDYL